MIYRKNSACRRASGNFLLSRCSGGVQLDITAATSSKPKVLQTASSISWLTLFLHPPQPTAPPSSSFFLYSLPFSYLRLPPLFKNFSTRRILETFKSLPVSLELFKNLSPFPFRSHLSLRRSLRAVSCLSPRIARCIDYGERFDATLEKQAKRLICNWNVEKSRGLNWLVLQDETNRKSEQNPAQAEVNNFPW